METAPLATKLTSKVISSGKGSSYTVPNSAEQCADARDALAKQVYVHLFDWLIERLNVALAGEGEDLNDDENFVGLLDIFGFENFKFNSFEQLCINFTNERLQAHFMDALVKLQQEEYKREGIKCDHIAFPDNSAQIALIDGKNVGVMARLDEECSVPKGSNEGFVEKLHIAFKDHALYAQPKRGKGSIMMVGTGMVKTDLGRGFDKLQFIVTHYAGQVMYTAHNLSLIHI